MFSQNERILKISPKYVVFQPCNPHNTPQFTETTPLTCPFQLRYNFSKSCHLKWGFESVVILNIDDDEDFWLFCIMYLHSRVRDCFHLCTLRNKKIKALKSLESDACCKWKCNLCTTGNFNDCLSNPGQKRPNNGLLVLSPVFLKT